MTKTFGEVLGICPPHNYYNNIILYFVLFLSYKDLMTKILQYSNYAHENIYCEMVSVIFKSSGKKSLLSHITLILERSSSHSPLIYRTRSHHSWCSSGVSTEPPPLHHILSSPQLYHEISQHPVPLLCWWHPTDFNIHQTYHLLHPCILPLIHQKLDDSQPTPTKLP